GSPDLACTVEEADAYFAMLGIQVAAAERDELLRRTEGWMAGLRLAAMSARAAPQERGRFTRNAGDLPIVTDYLWDEVLGRQPPETRLLMLRTSLTEQTSGDLAYALTGEPGGGRPRWRRPWLRRGCGSAIRTGQCSILTAPGARSLAVLRRSSGSSSRRWRHCGGCRPPAGLRPRPGWSA